MPAYTWLNFLTARQQLAARLADPNMVFWTDTELKFYIWQALRIYNSLTFTWKQDYAFTSSNLWNSLGSLTGSPRQRTLYDTFCYTNMEYMLLEPATGGVWTGTNQFNISDLSQALQRRRDEMLQVSNCNQSLLTGIPLTPGTTRTILADTVIDIARVRYIPVTGNPTTLYRDDTVAQEFYESPLYQQPPGTPQTFMVSSEPPLSFDVDIAPNQTGTYEAVVLQSGAPFNPPAATLLGIPDDFAWVLEWGALADLLGRESEATDRERADFCLKRYQDGLNLLLHTPWIMLGKVNGVAVSIDSIADSDRYSPEWDSNPTGFGPVIVAGGIDTIAGPVGSSIGVSVLGNAPVPTTDNDYVQVSKPAWDAVLDFGQSLAMFKCGGQEWKSALELEKSAIQFCSQENVRLRSTGAFADVLLQRGQVQEMAQNRYNTGEKTE